MRGDVVVMPFPFSDLSQAKRRPALIVANVNGDDVILCQITSQPIRDQYAVEIDDRDFADGGLRQASNVRPNRIFTADRAILLYRLGQLRPEKMNQVIQKIVQILQT
jgi:mRNA interferase MazF